MKKPSHVPGETGIWLIIFGELLFFAVLFVTYLYYRTEDPRLFAASQRSLDQSRGVVLTLVLLTASFLVVLALGAVREGQPDLARRLLLGAIVCGLAFSVLKGIEYQQKFASGIDTASNDFYMLYFILTGFHLLHVVVGLLVLAFMSRVIGKPVSPHWVSYVESGACYWHMVDLVWLVIFPLLYLVR